MGQSLSYLPCGPTYGPDDDTQQLNNNHNDHNDAHTPSYKLAGNLPDPNDPPPEEVVGKAGGSNPLKLQKPKKLLAVNTQPPHQSAATITTPMSPTRPPSPSSATAAPLPFIIMTRPPPRSTPEVEENQVATPTPTSTSTSTPTPQPTSPRSAPTDKKSSQTLPTSRSHNQLQKSVAAPEADFFTDMKPKIEAAVVVEPVKPSRLAMELGSMEVEDAPTSAWDDEADVMGEGEGEGEDAPVESAKQETAAQKEQNKQKKEKPKLVAEPVGSFDFEDED